MHTNGIVNKINALNFSGVITFGVLNFIRGVKIKQEMKNALDKKGP
jgi:hypothetical protein